MPFINNLDYFILVLIDIHDTGAVSSTAEEGLAGIRSLSLSDDTLPSFAAPAKCFADAGSGVASRSDGPAQIGGS